MSPLFAHAAVAFQAQSDSTQTALNPVTFLRDSFTPVAYAVLVVALLFITAVFIRQLVRAIQAGDAPRVESHWGGFGGGLGGWQLSPALTYLVAVIVFAALTGMAVRDASRQMPIRPVAAADTSTVATPRSQPQRQPQQRPQQQQQQQRAPASDSTAAGSRTATTTTE